MLNLEGSCRCGNISLKVVLTQELSSYSPRACDCDFCKPKGISYLSDPKGSLEFFANYDSLEKLRQGSETAEFLFCQNCQDILGVIYDDQGKLYGAVNSRMLDAQFGEEVIVSPKKLSKEEKTSRWREVWFSNVKVNVT